MNSATFHDTYPEYYQWNTTYKTNCLLADIYDLLSQINANMVGGFQHKAAKHIKRYERPGDKNKREKHLGNNQSSMPVQNLRSWIEEQRALARKKRSHQK